MKKLVIVLSCVLVACNASKKVVYMQDADQKSADTVGIYAGIVVQPKDILSIIVSSNSPEIVSAFNLPVYTFQAGSTREFTSYSTRMLGYLVDADGCIDFPVFGTLKVSGLTREQVSDMIKQRLIREDHLKSPIVNTEFMNFKISILGDVRSPGIYTIADDRFTLLEAISRAGDMTIFGRRDNVLVRREQNGIITFHRVDLRNAENLLNSPVYYLQQNDVVYVEPNKVQAGQSNINQNRTVGAWVSIASFLTSIAVLIINLK